MIHAVRNDFNATFLPKFPRQGKILSVSFHRIDITSARSFTDWTKNFGGVS